MASKGPEISPEMQYVQDRDPSQLSKLTRQVVTWRSMWARSKKRRSMSTSKTVQLRSKCSLDGITAAADECRIRNPLAHLSNEEVIKNVQEFARVNDFPETDLLIKGALIAKDPPAFESVPGLTEPEKEAIRNEVLHKWRQPRMLYFTIILCSIGAAVQGWDQTGSNGANLSFPDALGIPVKDTLADGSPNPNASRNQWYQGLVNAGPYIASAFL